MGHMMGIYLGWWQIETKLGMFDVIKVAAFLKGDLKIALTS